MSSDRPLPQQPTRRSPRIRNRHPPRSKNRAPTKRERPSPTRSAPPHDDDGSIRPPIAAVPDSVESDPIVGRSPSGPLSFLSMLTEETAGVAENVKTGSSSTGPSSTEPSSTEPSLTEPSSDQNSRSNKRTRHNESIKRRILKTDLRRELYMAKNADILNPFVEEKVRARLSDFLSVHTEQEEEGEGDIVVHMQPDMIVGQMRDYQLMGLNWMMKMHRKGVGMILGDEMGLGKTLQTISLFCHLKETNQISGPSLVIAPLSALHSWMNELDKWAPTLSTLRFHSTCPLDREARKQSVLDMFETYDVIVTTYEMAKNPVMKTLWERHYFNYVVLDEGHIIKEHSTVVSQSVRRLHFANSLILTGTPLQNNLIELWTLLNFLYPKVFTVKDAFAAAFNLCDNKVDRVALCQARQILSLFMLRRLKAEVEKMMPKKVETKVICPLSKIQKSCYKALLLKDIHILADADADADDRPISTSSAELFKTLNSLCMQLRKCCNHPFLFDGVEGDIEKTTCQELMAASGKLAVLDKLLLHLFQKGHRAVLFSQFTRVLDIIEDFCQMRGWDYCRFDGSTPRARRNFTIERFNAKNSPHFLFLMTTRSGGMGLNLQTADTCILFDSDWNPQADIQAQARVHRIGQKKTVHVYRLVTGGTLEERILEQAQKKLYLDQMVNHKTSDMTNVNETKINPGEQSAFKLSTARLFSALKFGSDAVFGDANSTRNALPTDEDIARITDRERPSTRGDAPFSTGKLKVGANISVEDFDATRNLTGSHIYNGVDFKALKKEHMKRVKRNVPARSLSVSLNDSQHVIRKRERKSRIVVDLTNGESSVYDQELMGYDRSNEKKNSRPISGRDFESQIFCQYCGDGGELLCCPNCPVCIHMDCYAIKDHRDFYSCSHHRCDTCQKGLMGSGGILFPCQSCPRSYCDDCLPRDKIERYIGECPRFELLGFHSTKSFCYIHCTKECEKFAVNHLGWVIPKEKGVECPPPMDASFGFAQD